MKFITAKEKARKLYRYNYRLDNLEWIKEYDKQYKIRLRLRGGE